MAREIYEKSSGGDVKVSGASDREEYSSGGDWIVLAIMMWILAAVSVVGLITSDYTQGGDWEQDVVDSLNLAMDADETAVFKAHVTDAITELRLHGHEHLTMTRYVTMHEDSDDVVYESVEEPETGLSYLVHWAYEADASNLGPQNIELSRMKIYLRGYEYPFDYLSPEGAVLAAILIATSMFIGLGCFMYGDTVSRR